MHPLCSVCPASLSSPFRALPSSRRPHCRSHDCRRASGPERSITVCVCVCVVFSVCVVMFSVCVLCRVCVCVCARGNGHCMKI